MVQPWQPYIHQSFDSARLANSSRNVESVFYGPYTRLLYTLFSLDSNYEIVPRYKAMPLIESLDSIDFVAVFMVGLNRYPVFFMQVKPSAALHLDSEREGSDKQMRRCFRDLGTNLAIPTLHGVSAFGTRLRFYRYDRESSQPHSPPYTEFLTDVAWDCDILEEEGAARFKDVIEHTKQMCLLQS